MLITAVVILRKELERKEGCLLLNELRVLQWTVPVHFNEIAPAFPVKRVLVSYRPFYSVRVHTLRFLVESEHGSEFEVKEYIKPYLKNRLLALFKGIVQKEAFVFLV